MESGASFFPIGKIVAVKGIQGQLIAQHTLGKDPVLTDWKIVFIEPRRNSYIPYFIQQVYLIDDNQLLFKLEEIDTREQALRLIHKPLYLPEAEFRSRAPHSLLRLLGYHIINANASAFQSLGQVEEIIQASGQLIVKTHFQNRELLIPLNEHTWIATDHAQQTVQVKPPEGLIDVYLQK